jgi:hypothetical protein
VLKEVRMTVRVLRLIEYIYVDAEAAEHDMQRWTAAVFTDKMEMKSATIQHLNWTDSTPADHEVEL